MMNFTGVKQAVVSMVDGVSVVFEDKQLEQFLMQLNDKGNLKGDLVITENEPAVTKYIIYAINVTRIKFIY